MVRQREIGEGEICKELGIDDASGNTELEGGTSDKMSSTRNNKGTIINEVRD